MIKLDRKRIKLTFKANNINPHKEKYPLLPLKFKILSVFVNVN